MLNYFLALYKVKAYFDNHPLAEVTAGELSPGGFVEESGYFVFYRDDAEELVQELETSDNFTNIEVEIFDDEDWQTNWQQYWHPCELAGGIWVDPVFTNRRPPEGKRSIKLSTTHAFGTGTHPTTKLCAEMLCSLDLSEKSVIDVGCGSGILSILSNMLGARSILGLDICEDIISTAKQNSALNKTSNCMFSTAALSSSADIVVANILSETLLSLWPTLKTSFYQHLILSGVLTNELEDFVKKLDVDVKIQTKEEWALILISNE